MINSNAHVFSMFLWTEHFPGTHCFVSFQVSTLLCLAFGFDVFISLLCF